MYDKTIEINGNLSNPISGLKNYDLFQAAIIKVLQVFQKTFGNEIMCKLPLLIDNGTSNTGHTPIITPVLNKYLIIKLCVKPSTVESTIIYQFSHELAHFIFYAYHGIDKVFATQEEESFCSAISLILIKELCPNDLIGYIAYVRSLSDEGYRLGIDVAERYNYDLNAIKTLIPTIQYVK